jgi:hypothetical protein
MMFEEAISITTYLPLDSMPEGNVFDFSTLCGACTTLPKLLALLNRSSPIGCLGQYSSTYELSIGIEGFTPMPGAHPTQGNIGVPESVASICFKTYVPGDTEQHSIEKFLQSLVEIHPWEHPLIEVSRVNLVRRQPV